jgi:hypothetical protein
MARWKCLARTKIDRYTPRRVDVFGRIAADTEEIVRGRAGRQVERDACAFLEQCSVPGVRRTGWKLRERARVYLSRPVGLYAISPPDVDGEFSMKVELSSNGFSACGLRRRRQVYFPRVNSDVSARPVSAPESGPAGCRRRMQGYCHNPRSDSLVLGAYRPSYLLKVLAWVWQDTFRKRAGRAGINKNRQRGSHLFLIRTSTALRLSAVAGGADFHIPG